MPPNTVMNLISSQQTIFLFQQETNHFIKDLEVQRQRDVRLPVVEHPQDVPEAAKAPPRKHVVEEPAATLDVVSARMFETT